MPNHPIIFFRELTTLFIAVVVPVKTVFKSEGVRDRELFPRDDPSRANFVGFDFEATIFKTKDM